MNLNNIQNIKIFSHDAASANVVLAYVYFKYNDKQYNIIAYPQGPAIMIFKNEISQIATIKDSVDYDFEPNDIVITGLSGVSSNYELNVIKIAKECKVYQIISLLDVARSIDDRFLIDDNSIEDYLPYKILIPSTSSDVSQYKQINERLEFHENLYWDYIYNKSYKVAPKITNYIIQKNSNNYIVFFTEYIKDQFGDALGYDEFSIMKDFLEIFANINIPILIKLHPSEVKNKYDSYIKNNSNIFIIKDEISTQEILYYAKVVFGCMTSVFYEALLLNKKSYSLQLNYKKDIFELTLENKIPRIETKEQLREVYNSIKPQQFKKEL